MVLHLYKARALLAGAILFSSFSSLEACSRIFWDNQINKVTSRTMDVYMDDTPCFTMYSRGMLRDGNAGDNSLKWTSKYGSLVVRSFNDGATIDGMNEKGLGAHVLYLEGTQYEARDKRPGISNGLWIQYFLDNFSTVKEALDSLKSFQVVSTIIAEREWPAHIALEDVTGDSVIIEFINGKQVIHHGPQYTVMTNEPSYDIQLNNLKRYKYFGGTLPLPGDTDPESRFVRCSAYLKTLPQPKNLQEAIGLSLSAIRPVQIPFGAEDTSGSAWVDSWPTRWAAVTDITNLTYYFNSTLTPNIVWVDLKKLDFSSKKDPVAVPLQDLNLVGDISDKFVAKNS